MKYRGYQFLFAIVAFILAIGLACSSLTSTPVAPQQPLNTSNNQPDATSEPQQPSNNSSSDLVTFTDKNDFYQIDVPSDWTHDTQSGDYGYVDSFTSPDGNALIENIMHDEGTAFAQKYKGQYALYLLHTYYSIDGKEGDIRISEDSIQKDGSERLTWTSRGRGTAGVSFFEVRNGSTFLMFTTVYVKEFEDQYLDVLNNVISSYVVP